jgi:hypothetical protein
MPIIHSPHAKITEWVKLEETSGLLKLYLRPPIPGID